MSNNAGRKPKYTIELLINTLKNYTEQNPHKSIKLSELARATSIPRHIWKDNKNVKEIIDKLNNTPIIAKYEDVEVILPNAEQLVESHYNSKPKLIRAIQDCFDVINDLYDKAMIGQNSKERENKYQERIFELEAQIRELKKEVQRMQKEIDLLYLDSESPTKRKNLGLKSNLIELDPANSKAISKKLNDLKDEYSGLFD